jgi:hypothetical protein
VLKFTSPADLPAGSHQLFDLQATVPATDAREMYRSQQILQIDNVTISDVNGDALPVVADDALHLVAYLGDASGNGAITTDDAVQVSRLAALLGTGLQVSLVTDPILVGDFSGNNHINATDPSMVAQFVGLLPVPRLPPIPEGIVVGGVSDSGKRQRFSRLLAAVTVVSQPTARLPIASDAEDPPNAPTSVPKLEVMAQISRPNIDLLMSKLESRAGGDDQRELMPAFDEVTEEWLRRSHLGR